MRARSVSIKSITRHTESSWTIISLNPISCDHHGQNTLKPSHLGCEDGTTYVFVLEMPHDCNLSPYTPSAPAAGLAGQLNALHRHLLLGNHIPSGPVVSTSAPAENNDLAPKSLLLAGLTRLLARGGVCVPDNAEASTANGGDRFVPGVLQNEFHSSCAFLVQSPNRVAVFLRGGGATLQGGKNSAPIRTNTGALAGTTDPAVHPIASKKI